MQDSMDPREVVEEVKSTGQRSGGIKEEVVQHDHIGFDTDDSTSPADVRLQHILVEYLRQLDVRGIPEYEDSGVEIGMFGVVHGLHGVNRFPILTLVLIGRVFPPVVQISVLRRSSGGVVLGVGNCRRWGVCGGITLQGLEQQQVGTCQARVDVGFGIHCGLVRLVGDGWKM